MKDWVIGIYLRLSLGDSDLGNKKEESNSISHQRVLIGNYLEKQVDLTDCERYEFFDDGYSGTNFERPGFEKMIEKVRNREINCVIVKDFSRFGRDYIELGDYMERIFPFLGVRFISVNDGYDSLDYKGTTGGLDVVMKNIVYTYYSKDLSVKTSTAKRMRMKRGEAPGLVPYGYQKDPDNKKKMIIDPEAAAVVREIYESFLGGMKLMDIIRMLNKRGVESPAARYRRTHPEHPRYDFFSEKSCWSQSTVRKIIGNEAYTGTYIAHKRQSAGLGTGRTVKVPEEEQIRIENAYEAIISREVFDEAQKRRKKQKAVFKRLDYPLAGKVKCGHCGRRAARHKYPKQGIEAVYYCCGYAREQGGMDQCPMDTVPESDIYQVIRDSLCSFQEVLEPVRKKVKDQEETVKKEYADVNKKSEELHRMRENLDSDLMNLAERYWSGSIKKTEFQRKKEKLESKVRKAEEELEKLRDDMKNLRAQQNTEAPGILYKIESFDGETETTGLLIRELVDKVVFYDKTHLEIHWKIPEELMKLLKGGQSMFS